MLEEFFVCLIMAQVVVPTSFQKGQFIIEVDERRHGQWDRARTSTSNKFDGDTEEPRKTVKECIARIYIQNAR